MEFVVIQVVSLMFNAVAEESEIPLCRVIGEDLSQGFCDFKLSPHISVAKPCQPEFLRHSVNVRVERDNQVSRVK